MLDDRLGWVLAQRARAASSLISKACEDYGRKPPHAQILTLLSREGALSQQRLLEDMGVDPSVLVTLLNDLEHDGLALRRRDLSDRRRHIVDITERGAAWLAEFDRVIEVSEREVFAALDADERATLRHLLERLRFDTGCAEADTDQTG
ncbi:MarR family winged helix-turn-helix transcriptional regulator [Nocardia sp. NPDC004750]